MNLLLLHLGLGGSSRSGGGGRRSGHFSGRRGHGSGMRGCGRRRVCYCWRLGLDRRFHILLRLGRPGRLRDCLRPCGRFPCHRHRGLGIGIHGLHLSRRRCRFRHRLRPVWHWLLHRLRGRRPLPVAFGSGSLLARGWNCLGPCRRRLLHRQGRLGQVGVGCLRFRCCRGLGRVHGLCRRRGLGRLPGLGWLSGIGRILVGYRRFRGCVGGVLGRRGILGGHARLHLGFGQIRQQRFDVAGYVRRVNGVRRERFFLVHRPSPSQSIFGAPG